jgi:hypothetical protein
MRSLDVKTSAPARAAGLAFLALSLTACISVRVEKGVSDADRHFRKAYAEIARIEGSPRREARQPHRMCLLVHDAEKAELIRVSIPMWLVKMGLDLGEKASEHEHGGSFADRYELDWSAIRDLDRYGRGLLASVEEEKARVLIWLR